MANVGESLLLFLFVTHSLSFGPTLHKKKRKELEEWLNYPFPVLVPVNVEIFNFHNQAL